MTVVAEALTALAQEPWCFAPAQIASLTDFQLIRVYLEPAAERAKRFRQDAPPPPNRPAVPPREAGPDHEPGTDEHRRQVIDVAFMGEMGMSRQKAERLYSQQYQAWRAAKG